MWRVTVRSPDSEPFEIDLKTGVNTVGRLSANDITIRDISASRRHAEIIIDGIADAAKIRDLESTNGTFVNRQKITQVIKLNSNDVIRIGQVTLNVTRIGTGPGVQRPITGTHPFDREILLESLDQHAILLYEVARQLNTVVDVRDALDEVSKLIKRFMGVDGCEVILMDEFGDLNKLGVAQKLAEQALAGSSAEVIDDLNPQSKARGDQVHAAMCVPVISGEEILALLYIYRKGKNQNTFDQRDLQLAIAISHQAALTLQRMFMMEKVQKEQRMHQLLLRFLPPQDVNYLAQDYIQNDQLPELKEQKVTILFSDIADSTALAEKLGAQHFASILNRFYQEISNFVFKYGGTVRFLGDGIMAVFMGKESEEDEHIPEFSAVQAGLEIVHHGRSTGFLDKDTRVVLGVSINSGLAMTGYVGTAERAEYTVLGDTVNVAYRMQEYSRPYRVLVGPATMAAIVGRVQTQRIGEVSLRGREKSVQIYEVLPIQTILFDRRHS